LLLLVSIERFFMSCSTDSAFITTQSSSFSLVFSTIGGVGGTIELDGGVGTRFDSAVLGLEGIGSFELDATELELDGT
jgi:hypothetical protein